MIQCTVGLMAYNEESNIEQVLQALLNQQTSHCNITEIIVVASGCTDRTVELAQQVARAHSLVTVHVQPQRLGKAAAINELISLAQGEVIVLVGADTLPDPHALDHLVQPFADPTVGMTGARVVPLNDPRTFMGFAVQMLWHVHHRMALRWPKLGELVAFRNVVAELPVNSATDEVTLEALLSQQGYRLLYTPEAIVYNRGPETMRDFLIQRRRIFAGHLQLAANYHYIAASVPFDHLFVLAREAVGRYPGLLPQMIGVVLLESMGRLLGALDFLFGYSHAIWRPVGSTKRIQQERQPLTLVAVNCRAGTINPANLMRSLHRIPVSEGALFWWDHRHNQLLFMLPNEQFTRESLADRIKALAAYIGAQGRAEDENPTIISYRVVEFTPSLTLQSEGYRYEVG